MSDLNLKAKIHQILFWLALGELTVLEQQFIGFHPLNVTTWLFYVDKSNIPYLTVISTEPQNGIHQSFADYNMTLTVTQCICDFTSISRIQRPLRPASVFSMTMMTNVNYGIQQHSTRSSWLMYRCRQYKVVVGR